MPYPLPELKAKQHVYQRLELIDREYGRALPGRMITLDLPDTSTFEGVTKAVAVVIRAAATGHRSEHRITSASVALVPAS